MWLLLNYFKLSNGESKWYDIWIIFKLCNYIFPEWKKRKTFSNFRSFFSRFTITHVSRLYKYRKNSESAVFAASIYPRPCTKLQLEKPQDVSSHNCTTRVLHTVISTQSPSIDSNDYSSSPPFFFLPFHFLFHYHHRVIFHFSFLTFALLFCLCSGSWWYRWRCRQRGDRRRRRRREGRTSDAGARERDRHLMPRRRRKLSPVSAGFVGLLRGPGRIAD